MTQLIVSNLNFLIEQKIGMPIPLCDFLHLVIDFRTVFWRYIPRERLFKMLPLFFATGPMGKKRPTLMLHRRPDQLERIEFRVMHWEKKPLMSLFFCTELDQRFLLTLALDLLHKPGSQPLLCPWDLLLRPPLLSFSLAHLAWHHRISANHMQGTAIQKNQTARWDLGESLGGEPMLQHVPVTLGMIIACAVLRGKRQQRPCNQRVFLHGMHETPTSAFPAHTLDNVMG